jgi:CHAT domain-containing protein/tetratricopeptide (TPR) repeat protein
MNKSFGKFLWLLAIAVFVMLRTTRAESHEQLSCTSPTPSADEHFWVPLTTPKLPAGLADDVKAKEHSLSKVVFNAPNDDQLGAAIAEGTLILEQRTKYQGGDWWETINTRWILTGLQRAAHLTPLQRKRLEVSYFSIGHNDDVLTHAEELARCQTLRLLLGEDYPEYASCLIDSATFDESEDSAATSESAIRLAVGLYGKSLGTHHPDYAESLGALAGVLQDGEEGSQEVPCLYAKQIEILKSSGDPRRYAWTLRAAAHFYAREKQYPVAAEALSEAISLYAGLPRPTEAIVGRDTVDTLGLLYGSLANVYATEHSLSQAEEVYRKALSIFDNAKQNGSHYYTCMESDYADALAEDSKQSEAADVYLDLIRRSFGRWAQAFPTLDVRGKNSLISVDSRCNYARTTPIDKLFTLVFDDQRIGPEFGLEAAIYTKQLAYYAAQQENVAMISSVAKNPTKWRAEWEQMKLLRREYQQMTLPNFGSEVAAAKWETLQMQHANSVAKKLKVLDAALRRENAAYQGSATVRTATVESIKEALGAHDALIEYVTFHPYDFAHGQPRKEVRAAHYGVIAVNGGTQKITAFDLGDAGEVNALVDELRGRGSPIDTFLELASPGEREIKSSEQEIATAAGKLRRRIWQPFETSLSEVTRVYVAADGAINLVPFEIFSTSDEHRALRYLIEDKEIVYLGSAREFARLSQNTKETSQARRAVLIGNPAFSATPEIVAQVISRLAARPDQALNARLDGIDRATARLGDSDVDNELPEEWPEDVGPALARLVSTADKQLRLHGWATEVLVGEDAVEEVVETIDSPTVLQIATHGLFLKQRSGTPAFFQDPLLRSMLVFAGANTWKPSDSTPYPLGSGLSHRAKTPKNVSPGSAHVSVGDGLLTAYQVSSMNLLNTLLVNLTACETGIGDVTPDGVAGLRQAFLMAGARAVTISMWPVPAEESVEEMSNFYTYWLGNSHQDSKVIPPDRYKAFRRAELDALMAARNRHNGSGHPFFWAGFVYYGDPGDIQPSKLGADAASH